MKLNKIVLCSVNEDGNIVKKEIISKKISINLEEPNKLMDIDMRREFLYVLKKQIIMDIEKSDIIERLLFGESD